MRFFGFALGGAMQDQTANHHYRNRLTTSGTLGAWMHVFEQHLHEAGYLAMGGQIVDAPPVPAPKQRNTEDEKAAIKAGKSAKHSDNLIRSNCECIRAIEAGFLRSARRLRRCGTTTDPSSSQNLRKPR